MANKVKYNLKNVHYAKATISTDGTATFATPVAWPGAVSLSLTAENSDATFYADGVKYFQAYGNNGYSGSYEVAMIPDSFRKDILGEVENTDGILIEVQDAKPVPFALLFEFDGDANEVRHVVYNCIASRPNVEGGTTEDSVDVKTETIEFTASSIKNSTLNKRIVKSKCDDSSATAYGTWFTTVYQP